MNEAHLQFLASPAWAEILRTQLLPWIEKAGDLGDDVLEVGPGPGLTTDLIRSRATTVTAVELDGDLASALAKRMAGSNVTVVRADAADTGLPDARFSAATCFSMLHHVPTAEAQDDVLAEIHRVLRPGARLYTTDSRDLDVIRDYHVDDVFVPLAERNLVARLEGIGFVDVELEVGDYELRFTAQKPQTAP